jgi:hypothetical protein
MAIRGGGGIMADIIEAEKPRCFVISRIGEPNTQIRKHADQVLEHIIKETLGSRFNVERADDISRPGMITVQVIELLDRADLVVADLTGGNANVYYELAIRHFNAKPVVHLLAVNDSVPFDTKDLRYITYDIHDLDSVRQAKEELLRQAEEFERQEIITPIQVARLFAEPGKKGGDETYEMVKTVYSAVENVAAQVSAMRVLGQEVQLVGSAVEELSEMVAHLVPTTGFVMNPSLRSPRYFAGLGGRRFFGIANPGGLFSTSGDQQSIATANAIRAASGTESVQGPIGPIKSGNEKKGEGGEK